MPTTIASVTTALCVVARTVLPGPTTATRVRDLDDTPISLEQGDCPQVVVLPTLNKSERMSFDDTTGAPGVQKRDFVILVYYIDGIEDVPPWESRPRVAAWSDGLVSAISANDTLGVTADALYCTASAEVRDGLKYNGIPFRGAVITVRGYWYDC